MRRVILTILMAATFLFLGFLIGTCRREQAGARPYVSASFVSPSSPFRLLPFKRIPRWFYRQERIWREADGEASRVHIKAGSVVLLDSSFEDVPEEAFRDAEKIAQSFALREAARIHGNGEFPIVFSEAVFVRLPEALLCFTELVMFVLPPPSPSLEERLTPHMDS